MGGPIYSLTLIAGLMVMAGAIAFIGDKVGRRVGRRRLTLLGLRPRHTSVVITVLTGVIIAGVSLAILAGASNEVRMALFRIDEIQRMLAEHRRQLDDLQRQLDERQVALVAATEARDQAVQDRDRAVQDRARAQQELASAKALLDGVEKELASARGDLESTRLRLDETRKDLSFQMARVKQLEQLGETLASRVQDLQRQVASLEETEQELSEAILTLWNTAQRLQYGNVLFRREEILLSEVVHSDGTAKGAQQRLLDFLKRVEAAASARARQVRQAGAPEPAGDEDGVVRVSPEEFDEGVKVLAAAQSTWVVRARVDHNTLAGEPVVVRIELVPRSLAFRSGQVVAQGLVDPAQGRVEDQVLRLLRQANEVAITYGGMVTGPDGTVGKLVSADEFVRIVSELQAQERPVMVQAVAVQDTYNTEGPLSIRLQLEPPVSSPSP